MDHPLLGLAEGDRGFEAVFAPEVVETFQHHHGAEIADGPEGGDDGGDSGLEEAGGEADGFVGVFSPGEAGFAGGEDGEADAAFFSQVEGEDVFEGEEAVAHEEAAGEGVGEVGGAVAGEVDDRGIRQLRFHLFDGGFAVFEDGGVGEVGCGGLDFWLGFGEVLGGVVDGED